LNRTLNHVLYSVGAITNALLSKSPIDLQRALDPYPWALFSSTTKHFNLKKIKPFIKNSQHKVKKNNRTQSKEKITEYEEKGSRRIHKEEEKEEKKEEEEQQLTLMNQTLCFAW